MQISPTDGKAVLLDVHHSMDLATYNRTLRLQHSQNHCLAISHLGTAATRSVCTNIHFIQVGSTYKQVLMTIACYCQSNAVVPIMAGSYIACKTCNY